MIEKNVTEPPADDYAKERATRDKVANFRRRQIDVSEFCKPTQQDVTAKEGEDVSHAVPPRTDIVPQAKDQRIKIVQVVSEHWCAIVRDLGDPSNTNARHPERP